MSKTILIADDQADSRQLLNDILDRFRPYGVTVHVASDGRQAYEMAQAVWPDLILLDIMMPEMSGYEVCEKLKSEAEAKAPYIIMVSAKFQRADRTKAALVGADEFINKPYDIKLVLERVQAVLDITLA
ncbi:MAG: response regulator [Chloroflexi bacterium]|nr:response regulator [Chloroflexota bacterium]